MGKSTSAKVKAAASPQPTEELVAVDPLPKVFLDNVPHVPHLVPADIAEQLVATGTFELAKGDRAAEIAEEVGARVAAEIADRDGVVDTADEPAAEPAESSVSEAPTPEPAAAPDQPADADAGEPADPAPTE